MSLYFLSALVNSHLSKAVKQELSRKYLSFFEPFESSLEYFHPLLPFFPIVSSSL